MCSWRVFALALMPPLHVCSPARDWRAVVLENASALTLLPCTSERAMRAVPLGAAQLLHAAIRWP